MVLHWKLIKNKFISETFHNGTLTSKIWDIPIGLYNLNGEFTPTASFVFQNPPLHTWNIEIFLKYFFGFEDIYFNEDSDYLVVKDIDDQGCGFLFDDQFDQFLDQLVFFNDPRKSKFQRLDGTLVYDNRIVIINNPNFNDISKLSHYCKKLVMSPFRLNQEQSPYHLLKNYIFISLPDNRSVRENKQQPLPISGGLIRCNHPGFHEQLYEYDITAFYPNIIVKYVDKAEPIRILIEPIINDPLKILKLYLYGMLGNPYSILYNPRLMDFITTTGRKIIGKYETRAVIVATDAIFMKYQIIPDFNGFSYKSIHHKNVFVISASQYFTKSLYKGFPKNILSRELCSLFADFLISHQYYENAAIALIDLMKSFNSFPLPPIPLRNGELLTSPIKDPPPELVDKYGYLIKYRKAIFHICQFKSIDKNLDYQSFKIIYGYFSYA